MHPGTGVPMIELRPTATTRATELVVVAVVVLNALRTSRNLLIGLVLLAMVVVRMFVRVRADGDALHVNNGVVRQTIRRDEVGGFVVRPMPLLPFYKAVHVELAGGRTLPLEVTRRLVVTARGAEKLEAQRRRLQGWAAGGA